MKKLIIAIFILGILLICCVVLFIVYAVAGFGKCNFGKQLVFQGTRSEQCVDFGTKVDPLPDTGRLLRITDQHWTGWQSEQPKEIVKVLNLDATISSFDLEFYKTDVYQVNISKFDDSSIRLSVKGLGLKQGQQLLKPGINLSACGQQNFEIKLGEKVELYTCTMDAGVTWTLEYL